MAERAAAERRKHARFVAADLEAITDAGALAHELEDRSIAEVDRQAPQAMAERTDVLHAQVLQWRRAASRGKRPVASSYAREFGVSEGVVAARLL